jgi:hypothetical protein
MIGQHPEMYGLPEVNLFAAGTYKELSRIYRLRPGFRHGLLRAIAELGLGGQTEENVNAARAWLEEYEAVNTALIFQDLVEWSGHKRLVDKSPIYAYTPGTLERMLAAYPNARFMHLIRHPRATCESIYKLRDVVMTGLGNMKVGDRVKKLVEKRYERVAEINSPDSLWLKPHMQFIEFLKQIPEEQKFIVRGEEFMSNLDNYLLKVSEWLEISTSDEAIEAMKHPENSCYACYGPQNAKFGNDPSFLEAPALREYKSKTYSLDGPLEGSEGVTLSNEIKSLALEFGYEE